MTHGRCFWFISFLGFILLIRTVSIVHAEDATPPFRIQQPIRAWFQPQYLDTHPELYPHMTMVTSLADADLAEKLAKKGVTTLKWCYGPNSEYSQGKPEYYQDQCENRIKGKPFRFAGVGIDEWNPADKRYSKEKDVAASGYRAARKKWPDSLRVCWVTHPDETFIGLLRDGTFDLAIIEGYTFIPDVGGLTLDGIVERCETLKKANLLGRAMVCLGYISAKKDKTGRQMTFEDLTRLARRIKEKYPMMPGMAFYGYQDNSKESLELIKKVDRFSAELYPSMDSTK